MLAHGDYLSHLKRAVDSLDPSALDAIASSIAEAAERGKSIYVFGNGDSATNAMHFAADLSKGTIVPGRRRMRVVSLNENVPLMTAWANDTSYDQIYKEQLENHLSPGDVVIGISGSGNSMNIINAIDFANRSGALTIGFTAFDGGKLRSLARHCVVADTDSMEIAEDIHFIIGHLLKARLIRLLSGDA